MSDFFVNLWAGLRENKDSIIALLFSGTTASFVANFIYTYKVNKQNKLNGELSKNLNNTIKENLNIGSTVNNVKDKLAIANEALNSLAQLVSKANERQNVLNDKLNAMLDAFSMVYSTIKDEDVRNAVMLILANAKSTDNVQELEALKEINELKDQIADLKRELAKTKEELPDFGTITPVSESMVAEDSDLVMRY